MSFAQQGGYFVQVPQPTRFFGQGQAMRGGGQQRWPHQRQGTPGIPSYQNQFRNPRPGQRMAQAMGRPMGAVQPMMPMMAAARPGMPPQAIQLQPQPMSVMGGAPQIRGANYKFAPNVRNPGQVMTSKQQP